MKKRRLMAAMLAGTMALSSVAYADVRDQGKGSEHQITGGQIKVATDSNALVRVETPVSKTQTSGDGLVKNVKTLDENPDADQVSLTIRVNKKYFKKTYGQNDPTVRGISASDYEIVGGNVSNKRYLNNVKYTREEGEKPGKYKITSISCDAYPNGELKLAEESSYFVIEKKAIGTVTDRKVNIPDNGKEQTANAASLCYWTNDKKPTKIILKDLSEEDKAKFEQLPKVDENGVIHFTLKQLGNGASVSIPFTAEGDYYTYPDVNLVVTTQKVTLKTVEIHTAEEIKSFYAAHPFSTSYRDAWTVAPNAKNGVAGELTEGTVENALNALNFIRYIAGINADVTVDPEYAEKAQAGTTLLTEVGNLEHTPKKPSSVSQEFYDLGYQGTSSSNLGWGYSNLADAVIRGWMNDGDSSNIDRVGHRRWCINPTMGATGFGHS